jgi:hypothetical protein
MEDSPLMASSSRMDASSPQASSMDRCPEPPAALPIPGRDYAVPRPEGISNPRGRARYALVTAPLSHYDGYDHFLRKITDLVQADDNPIAGVTGQFESGGLTGYEHAQIVLYSRTALRWNQWEDLGDNCWHVETARKPDACLRYVHKVETRTPGSPRIHVGQIKNDTQGSRNDLEQFKSDAASAPTFLSLMENHTNVCARYFKFAQHYHMMQSKKARLTAGFAPPIVHVYWGDSGSGKTRRAFFEATNKYGHDVFVKPCERHWCDGYDGESAMIIDEFYGQISISSFLRITDGYISTLATKGGTAVSRLKEIWITSNSNQDGWWTDLRGTHKWNPEWDAAIQRRCTFTRFHKAYPWVPPEFIMYDTVMDTRPKSPSPEPYWQEMDVQLTESEEEEDDDVDWIVHDPMENPIRSPAVKRPCPFVDDEAEEDD